MEIESGDQVQIQEGKAGIKYKVGVVTIVITNLKNEVVGYKVKLANGLIVPVLKDNVQLKTHKERGNEWRKNNKRYNDFNP